MEQLAHVSDLPRKSGRRGPGPSLDRAIWRAGELALGEAVPRLLELLRHTEQPMSSRALESGRQLRRYCTIWALARCSGRHGLTDALPALERVYRGSHERANVRRLAGEGLRQLYAGSDRAAFLGALMDELPGDLARLARNGPAEDFSETLRSQLRTGPARAIDLLHTCYLIDNEHVRPAVLALASDAPLATDYFRALRALFKTAELRADGELFGLLAYRFEKTAPTYHYRWSSANLDKPFQTGTRDYLRRRVWRTLRRLGRDESPDYVKMAVGVLLPITDDDAGEPRRKRFYRWRQPDVIVKWDRFAGLWAFNHVLYGNSPRYHADRTGRAFRCSESYEPGQPAPDVREESFPALWERTPQGLLHLVDESRCARVHEFAVKALRACPDFLDELDADAVVMLLGKPYDVTVRFGVELARRLYRADAPDIELLIALVDCTAREGREQAARWIRDQRGRFVTETQLMAAVALTAHADTRALALELLREVSDEIAKIIIGRVIATINELDDGDRIRGAGDVLLQCFGAHIARIGAEIIRDLLAHPATAAQELAGRMLLEHSELANRVPDDILVAMLDADDESVRAIGARLFGQLGAEALAQRKELLVHLSLAKHAELREGVRSVIERLAGANPALARELADTFTDALMHKAHDGVHSHLLAILKTELRDHLAHLPTDKVLVLLHHKHPHAQELGGVLLATNIGPDQLSVAELVRLANHEILPVRRGAWSMCEKSLPRLIQAMPTAIRLLDAKWDDSRGWAMELFRDRFGKDELPPAILVAICDSVRPDVQQFGRELIMRHFDESDGHEYLLKLAEHPGESLQLFATGYLERYATGNPDRVRELEPFFVSVLSRVNKGRVSKQRCIAFLAREAAANADIAETAARIFARQSATMAIVNKAAIIRAMVDIHLAHPHVEQPIEIVPPTARGADDDPEVRGGV